MTVTDKVVLITGAGRGLGREYVISLAAAGARVVASDVLDCAGTVADARAAGGQAIGVPLDVTDMVSATAMVQAALDAYGRIDALVNNAALYGALRGGRFNADRGDGLGCRDGGERQGHLELLQGGDRCDARGRWRLDRQHRLACRDLWHALRAALHHVESRGDRADAWSRARAGPRQ